MYSKDSDSLILCVGPLQVEQSHAQLSLIKTFISRCRPQHTLNSWPYLWRLIELFVEQKGAVIITVACIRFLTHSLVMLWVS